ncbi:hypothetical protein DSL72_004829 [Monilinia vaccinii-corymbosi]|uniref:Hcy-binding domain-containing protein n=1 Tax=Monilinia vaccinii-corymbosi TaxID=61207 RepID=A0A8A3PA17_9HELO|nr:hypothetical protein DSL72_004829 [Monilinia vaccinii-corymbosi]
MSPNCKIHLLDGGLGTTLGDSHRVQFTQKEPLWSSQLLIPTHPHGPKTLLATQQSFVDAGADILLTATYQTSYEGFGGSGYAVHSHSSSSSGNEDGDKEVVDGIMRSAIDIAYNAFSTQKDSNGKIALSLGAYGAIMTPGQEYTGKYDDEHKSSLQLSSWHHERISVFSRDPKCWERIDYVAFETIPLLEEIEGVRKSMGEVERLNGKKPFWVACVFPGEGYCLPDGSSVQQAVQAMLCKKDGSPVPFGIGLNCTKVGKVEALIKDFEHSVNALVESKEISEWPSLVVYPDGTTKGEVYNTSTKVWEIREPSGKDDLQWDEAVLEIVKRTRERGFWREIIVGGCCKTTPREIGKLRERIDRLDEE